MIVPSLAAGFMMAFALSLDDLVRPVLSLARFDHLADGNLFCSTSGVKPEINAVASLILLVVSLATFWSGSLPVTRKKTPQNKQAD